MKICSIYITVYVNPIVFYVSVSFKEEIEIFRNWYGNAHPYVSPPFLNYMLESSPRPRIFSSGSKIEGNHGRIDTMFFAMIAYMH